MALGHPVPGRGGFPGGAFPDLNQLDEELTIQIAAGGTVLPPGRSLRKQADATPLQPFADVQNVINAVSYQLARFLIRLQLEDGITDVGNTLQAGAVQFGANPIDPTFGAIQFESLDSSGEIVPGTIAMTAVSSAADGSVVLAADPGYATDAFRKNNLVVVSGTGSGQSKPLESHSGTAMAVAGSFSPALNGTSVLEIRRPRATLRFDDNVIFPVVDLSPNQVSRFGLIYSDVISAGQFGAGSGITYRNGSVTYQDGAIARFVAPSCVGCDLQLANCVLDADASFGVSMQGGVIRTLFGNSQPHLISGVGGATPPINILNIGAQAPGASSMYIFGGHVIAGGAASFPNLDTGAVFVDGPLASAFFDVGSSQYPRLRRVSGIDAGLIVRNRGSARATSVSGLGATFTGATNDVIVDGVPVSWTAIDADPDDSVMGPLGSFAAVNE